MDLFSLKLAFYVDQGSILNKDIIKLFIPSQYTEHKNEKIAECFKISVCYC